MTYLPPLLHRNAHLATILPNRLRKVAVPNSKRITLHTQDDDFIDLDFYKGSTNRLAIVLHGLEGSSKSSYVLGMVRAFLDEGYSCAAMNQRSCSGRPNKQFCSYHSGKTDDLDLVVNHFVKVHTSIVIIGSSLGGNITLKYASEKGEEIPPQVKAVAGISVPIDLKNSCEELHRSSNFVYLTRFIRQLKRKALEKAIQFPDKGLTPTTVNEVRNFYDFDNVYTAPAHGFKNAFDYYEQCSSKFELCNIAIPALLINAQNDPILGPSCYLNQDEIPENLTYLAPKYGGHVGFAMNNRMTEKFWSELQVLDFLNHL